MEKLLASSDLNSAPDKSCERSWTYHNMLTVFEKKYRIKFTEGSENVYYV